MKLAICFLSTVKDHFNLKLLKEQCKTSKLHNIDIYEYINLNDIDYKVNNSTIYFNFEYLKNKFNYHHTWYNYNAKNSAGIQFLTLLDMYDNHKNEYDMYLFYEDDLSYFGTENLFDKIDLNCDIIFQDNRIHVEDDRWTWYYDFDNKFDNELIIYHGLLNIYGIKNYIFNDLIKFIHNNYIHHEGLISTYALNNHNYKIHYINNYITTYLDWNDSYNNYNDKYDLIHPIKSYEKYNKIIKNYNYKSYSKYSSYQFDRSFKLDYYHKELTIWQAYHNEYQIKKYKLFETNNKFLFNTSNLGYNGKHINHLNRLFCESTCVLYPYFNDLKSDLIGFQHYKRIYNYDIHTLKINEIKKGKIQVFWDDPRTTNYQYLNIINKNYYINIISHCCFWREYENGFYDDIIEYLLNNFPEYLETEKKLHNFHACSLFVCTWEKYIKLCDLIWGYLTFISNKYQFDVYSEFDWVKFIKEKFILYNRNNNVPENILPWNPDNPYGYNNWCNDDYLKDLESFRYYRIFALNIEYLISMFVHSEGYIYDEHNKALLKR